MTNAIQIRASDIDNINRATAEDISFDKILKFNKGKFFIQTAEVPLGTEYLAHTAAWVKCWVKFIDGKVEDRKVYRVAYGEKPPEREDLDDLDDSNWPLLKGKKVDPWVYQYQVPFENLTTGELVVFTTPSAGGRTAIADLCAAYAKRAKRMPNSGQPIIRLASATMQTKNFGGVLRPMFEIVRWDDLEEIEPPAMPSEDDINDAIPF